MQKYPENTLIAFQAAMDAGAPMVELDVTFSRDRKLVVIHDETLDRTTNGHGPVHEYTLEELKHLDAGSWFHSDFAEQRLPELGEVLDLFDGRVIANIEIKFNAYEPHHPHDAIEKQVVKLAKEKKKKSSALKLWFDVKYIKNNKVGYWKTAVDLKLIAKEKTNPDKTK